MESAVHTVETDVAVIVDGLQVLRAVDGVYFAVLVHGSIDGAVEEVVEVAVPEAHIKKQIEGIQASVCQHRRGVRGITNDCWIECQVVGEPPSARVNDVYPSPTNELRSKGSKHSVSTVAR